MMKAHSELRWFGYTERMNEERLVRRVYREAMSKNKGEKNHSMDSATKLKEC